MAYGIVPPERDTLTLPDGDTLTIKRRLNTGELRTVLRRSRTGDAAPDQLEYTFQLVLAHLLDWSSPAWPPIAGTEDAVRTAILNGLDPDDYTAVTQAIVRHVQILADEREAAKKKDGWDTELRSDLAIAIRCGWRLEWVRELDPDEYLTLVDMLTTEPR